MDQYAMYLRKSRVDMEAEARGEGETLARHKTILHELAARHGHGIGMIYEEIVSGETIADRPEVQRLLADVASGKWTGVYVMEVERLARGDTMDQGRMAQTFLYSHTKIVTPMRTYNPSDDADLEYFEFSLFMSRREYKTINRRIQAGRMQSIREGKYIASRPAYGYRKIRVPNGKGYTLEIIPEEADIVRQIFAWYLHGHDGEHMGITRIAKRLSDLRIDPGEQGGAWKFCRIQRMLINEVYIGKIRWGRVREEKRMAGHIVEKSRGLREDYVLFDGLHEPIIDDEVFFAVREKLSGIHVPMRQGMALTNVLAGLVYCEACGHLLRGLPASGRFPAKMYCATHGCNCVRTYRAPLEEAILSSLREWLALYEVGNVDSEQKISDASMHNDAMIRDALDVIGKEALTLNGQKNRLHDLLEQGIYTPEVFAERMVDLKVRIAKSEEDQKRLQAELQELRGQRHDIALLLPAVHHVLDVYDAAESAQEKNELLKSVISRVDYFKEIKGNQHVDPNQFTIRVYPRVGDP